ncbi:MAG: hypothetical protein KAH01_02635 [Caldisericia bacterium]|nr:hypothetical protein [Caldisericia bacterium]
MKKKSLTAIFVLFIILVNSSCFQMLHNYDIKGNRVSVYLNGKERSRNVLKIDKAGIYLKAAWLNAALGMDIFIDSREKAIVYTDKYQVVYIKNDNNLDSRIDLIWEKDQPFVHINRVEMIYKGKIDWNNEKKVLIIDSKDFQPGKSKIERLSRVRKHFLDYKNTVGYFKKDFPIDVIEQKGKWTKVKSNSGSIGWVKTKNVSKIYFEKSKPFSVIDKRTNVLLNPKNKIIMVWQYVYQTTPEPSELYIVNDLDVIAPTWLSLKSGDGDIRDKGRKDYIDWAHKNDYQVWITSSNSFSPALTSEVLNSTKKRKKVIDELIRVVLSYNADGLNLDWENIYLKDKRMFTQFLRELYPMVYKNGLILSIDITTISKSENWSMCYDRNAICKTCDFVVLMAYDQYWAGGNTSGSVAELPWVEKGVVELLEFTTPGKIIMGIPFYSRLWKETNTNNVIDVESEAYYMDYSLELAQKHHYKWDKEISQYYCEWTIGKTKYRLWIDEKRSILEKMKLLRAYGLKGVAFWRKGYEDHGIWEHISKAIR